METDFSDSSVRYKTRGGVQVHLDTEEVAARQAIESLAEALDTRRGALLSSSYEYPGRYTRWDLGFVDPPVVFSGAGSEAKIEALNERGSLLLNPIARCLQSQPNLDELDFSGDRITCRIGESTERFPEEERSKQPSLFSIVRALIDLFGSEDDPHLGLYGAFGYDLALQFEPVKKRLKRDPSSRDLVLYLPDEILVVDHRREMATRRMYRFEIDGETTKERRGGGESQELAGPAEITGGSDHNPGAYAENVRSAREAFRRGDLFEVVLSQTFREPAAATPSTIFQRLQQRNPSPYGFLINLGEEEHLVGASPEMYVRVEGDRVETCPISGTIPRGQNAIEDAEQIRTLMNSEKDESELTMCTDVDRNDKSRICEPGSVRVIGRRQIELYSRLIHTVDHVEGRLREGFDALDAFLCHAWAVTVTGAPKPWAMQFVEDHEESERRWYGGAVGFIGFDGNMNTGLTLRTTRLHQGVAEVRAGATLLFDSDPEAEELETRVKASALLDAILHAQVEAPLQNDEIPQTGAGRRVLLIDHKDSFVHTLANYLRQTGAEVITWRSGFEWKALDDLQPDLVVLSPGPGSPSDFDVSGTLTALNERGLPVFGVCLGLQGMVEYCGGTLDLLPLPMHGKPSTVFTREGSLWEKIPEDFRAARYHSLYARRETMPKELRVTAESEDGIVMAIEHESLPMAAVQFHPESILTRGSLGVRLLANVMEQLVRKP
ncbi:MAG: anthranilate synthase component I [Spirochaeta sp.]|nr:anthranilate synthase component I [Spirochaeta sp.]RPG06332.1 MAG: anthranilate synthase component I [Proteobacteria bacterium TMED72]